MARQLPPKQWIVFSLIILALLAGTGWAFFMSHSQTKDSDYFRNKYQNSADTNTCVQEFYAAHPDARPENHKPNTIYLAPPCPGIPQ